MNITAHRPAIYLGDENLKDFDAVIPRIGASATFYGTAVLRQFEMQGVYPLNETVAKLNASLNAVATERDFASASTDELAAALQQAQQAASV